MGANAQTTVPTFTAGQVLTAAQMNNSARTGVPVFANTTARDAGFGGTGEKTLAEGQFCYLESNKQLQYYDGTTWKQVNGSTLVASGSATSGTAVNVNNCFTTTYANYTIVIWDCNHAGITNGLRLRASGSDNSTTNYDFGRTYVDTIGTGFDGGGSAQTSFSFGSSSGNVPNSFIIQVIQPQAAKQTQLFFVQTSPNAVRSVGFNGFGIFKATTQFDGFSFLAGGTISSFNYAVYGWQNS